MIQGFAAVVYMLISSSILSPIVWGVWNFVLQKLFPGMPHLEWLDAMILLMAIQVVPFFLVRKVEIQYLPQYIPYIPKTEKES